MKVFNTRALVVDTALLVVAAALFSIFAYSGATTDDASTPDVLVPSPAFIDGG